MTNNKRHSFILKETDNMYQNLLKWKTSEVRLKSVKTALFGGFKFFILWVFVFSGTFTLLHDLGFMPKAVEEIGNSFLPEKGYLFAFWDDSVNAGSLAFSFSKERVISISKVFASENIGQSIENVLSFGSFKPGVAAKKAETAAVENRVKKAELAIPAVSLTASIEFPDDASNDSLNKALARGVVHYPYSPYPGEKGNVFLLGHSTRLPVSKQSAYRSFNDIKKLKKGDPIFIRYNGKEYEYKTHSIEVGRAENIVVNFRTEKNMLTLSTCWLFGEDIKEDRYILEAEFMKSYPLSLARADTSS